MKFQDPPKVTKGWPPGKRGAYKHTSEADALKQRPNQWALVFEGKNLTMANQVKKGILRAFAPSGSFEATGRKRPDGTYDIYVRYVGGAQ